MTIRRRQKLSDVAQESRPVNGRTFEEAFPQIKKISLEVRECDADDFPAEFENVRPRFYTGARLIDCHNPMCYRGGVDLANELVEMVAAGQTTRTVVERCQGYEGSPKGQRRYCVCHHEFQIVIAVEYHQ